MEVRCVDAKAVARHIAGLASMRWEAAVRIVVVMNTSLFDADNVPLI